MTTTEKSWTVYLLHASDEPDTPRYVGQTSTPLSSRRSSHMQASFGPSAKNASVNQWIRTVYARGAEVDILPIKSGLTEAEAYERESQEIEHLKASITNKEGHWRAPVNLAPPPRVRRTDEELLIELGQLFSELSARLGPEGLAGWERTTTGSIVRRTIPQDE